jgi:GT2 family glycosyltransferase/glycosyltransferase involved in cell wall biosynthesis
MASIADSVPKKPNEIANLGPTDEKNSGPRRTAEPQAKTAPIGNLEGISHHEISGWVWDPEQPNLPVDVEILDGDETVLRLTADEFRSDLLEAGLGDGRHGFTVAALDAIFPLSRHRVRVRRTSDGLDLPGSPTWIVRLGMSPQTERFISQAISSAVEAASASDELDQLLAFLLPLLSDAINIRDALARAADEKKAAQSAVQAASDLNLTGRTRELINSIRAGYQPLHFEPTGSPEVTIIIPVHNKFSYTYDCLRSIHDARSERTFEIVIVDDCSDDETLLASLVFSGAVRVCRNEKNLMFVRASNAGAKIARGKYLLFLNNDTLVRPGWLDSLVDTFEHSPNIGVAGSKLLFPDGKLQEAGGIVWRLGDGWNWGQGRDPGEPSFSFMRDADWVSGTALMIERSLFNQLGGFDEHFAPAYYEDTDLAFRVRALGKRVVVQTASEVIHLERISAGTDTSGPGMKRFQVANQAKFYRRWKDVLLAHRFNGREPELESERAVRRRAYFIDEIMPTPDQDAGSNAAVEHMKALIALGYKVTFIPAHHMARIDPYTRNLQKLGIECLYHPYYSSVDEILRKAVVKPNVIYLHRYANASKYAIMARHYCPNASIVYGVADLHFLRMERQLVIEPGTTSAAEVESQKRAEMAAMRHADSVIVHSSVEAAILHDSDASLNVRVVPWTVKVRPVTRPLTERKGTAFVGGFRHLPNIDAVRYLVRDILPLARKKLQDFLTFLVGSNMPDEFLAMREPGVVPVGHIPVLADVLENVRCTVAPLRYGAGIKGKVLESFAHGLPCVMSEIAAEGLELPDNMEWMVARSPAEYAEKLVQVHEDEALNRTLSEKALFYIERRHGAASVMEALNAAIERL